MKYALKTILSFEVGAGIKPPTFHAGFQTSAEISDAIVDMETLTDSECKWVCSSTQSVICHVC